MRIHTENLATFVSKISCAFQIIKQSLLTKCTSHWALVPVISHSEHVMYAAAVTRWEVQFRKIYFNCALINKDFFVILLIRTVPRRSWSYLCPSVSQDPLEDTSLLLQIISALFSLLKTPLTGFHFCVSVLLRKTTPILVSFTGVTQCENRFFLKYILWIAFVSCSNLFSNSNLCSTANPGPSFQGPVLSAPIPVNVYTEGNPIFTLKNQYFTIPQVSIGV